jgi:hypothetical protein
MKYVIGIILASILITGCTTRAVSNTPRTAIEQLLLSTAVDTAFEKVNLPRLSDKKVYIDLSNLESYDSEYVKSAFKAYLGRAGAVFVENPEEADYVINISCGALGNEYKDTLFGIPALPIPGSPVSSPELALWKSVEQDGIAKFLVVIYSNGKADTVNHYYGKAERDEIFFLWMRSQPKDDIRKAWEKADKKLEDQDN